MTSLDRLYQIVQSPVLTEKGASGADVEGHRRYQFRVPLDANKVEIRQAIEKLFGVKVSSVNTLRTHSKVRRRGYVAGATPRWKKAMVTLREGQIDIL